jgi:hypothetical protein
MVLLTTHFTPPYLPQVPLFGPRLPTETPVFEKGRDFTEFLYTKRAPPPPPLKKAPLPCVFRWCRHRSRAGLG